MVRKVFYILLKHDVSIDLSERALEGLLLVRGLCQMIKSSFQIEGIKTKD